MNAYWPQRLNAALQPTGAWALSTTSKFAADLTRQATPSKMPTPEELLAVERISAEDLAAALQSDAEHPVIVDVRNEDYELLGHIVNAEHLPSATFKEDADVDALVAKFGSKQNIVFHCGHSNTRGPTCALRFIERAEAAGVKTHVRVLAGGFADFAEKFSGSADLVTPPSKPTETE